MAEMREFSTVAREYLALGWSVIPMLARGKRPAIGWLEFQRRRPTAAELKAWFDIKGQPNIGIVTGAVSGLVVIDIDIAHGGQQSLERLEARNGALPQTVEALTGGGGRHLYFAHPGAMVPTRVGIADGIDVRADGGCVVAPPSEHASGRHYRWAANRAPWQARLAPLPPWLLRLIQGGNAIRAHVHPTLQQTHEA